MLLTGRRETGAAGWKIFLLFPPEPDQNSIIMSLQSARSQAKFWHLFVNFVSLNFVCLSLSLSAPTNKAFYTPDILASVSVET